jgi:hypothetical protein
MKSTLERVAAARQACAAALDTLGARVPARSESADEVSDGGASAEELVTWDGERALEALGRVGAAFEALGPPEALSAEVAPSELPALLSALLDLARIHAVLTMSVAREKDGLRDRLQWASTAGRAFGWHASEPAGLRCDMRG